MTHPTHPTTRVLAMLELLQAHPRLRVAELARRLEVDERTVRRYAARLADLGVPVVADRGRYGGYRLMPGYKLPPLMLDDDEALAVVLGLLAGRRLGMPGPPAESALAKIGRVLPDSLRERVRALAETLEFTLPGRTGTAPGTPSVLALAAAVRERTRVRVTHLSRQGDAREREVDPYGIVFHSGRWYLTGHDHASGEVRTFRVDRITDVTALAGHFAVPADADPVRQVNEALAAVPYAHEIEVVLFTDEETARARVPSSVATLTPVDDGVLLRTRAERLDGMARMLAGLGLGFRIVRPDQLRGAVRDLAERLARDAG